MKWTPDLGPARYLERAVSPGLNGTDDNEETEDRCGAEREDRLGGRRESSRALRTWPSDTRYIQTRYTPGRGSFRSRRRGVRRWYRARCRGHPGAGDREATRPDRLGDGGAGFLAGRSANERPGP